MVDEKPRNDLVGNYITRYTFIHSVRSHYVRACIHHGKDRIEDKYASKNTGDVHLSKFYSSKVQRLKIYVVLYVSNFASVGPFCTSSYINKVSDLYRSTLNLTRIFFSLKPFKG